MLKPFFFFCAAALGGFYITGHDVSDIKRMMLNISGQSARAVTAHDLDGDWGS